MQTALTIAVLILIALQLWPRVQPLVARLPYGAALEWLRANLVTLIIAMTCGVLLGKFTPGPIVGDLRNFFPSIVAKTSPSRIAFFHESEHGQLPGYIGGQEGALGKLRAAGRTVWAGDIDAQDGTGDVPEWAKDAIAPARQVIQQGGKGTVALVLFDGDRVRSVAKAPGTLDGVLEACK